ncbi:MAG: 2-isopropylmalate synthase, partial [Thiovulaceae bacterium]|nr:2-isopropylmalate synthase [Sulfurimonadaceae bacterium]
KDSIRINSQSGKGGVTYILKEFFDIDVPNEMQAKLTQEVKTISQKKGKEISSDELLEIYKNIS